MKSFVPALDITDSIVPTPCLGLKLLSVSEVASYEILIALYRLGEDVVNAPPKVF